MKFPVVYLTVKISPERNGSTPYEQDHKNA